MDIKTKYDLGQSVFFMKDNKVATSAIKQISIDVWYNKNNEIRMRIHYYLFSVDQFYEEDNLFLTKEELIESL